MLHLLPWLFLLPMTPMQAAGPDQVVVVEEDPAPAQLCPEGFICVPPEDMAVFVQLLRDQKCRAETEPKIIADSVVIIVDRQGRVYGSGTGPKPYKLHVDWCNYQLDAESEIHLDVAQRVEPTWGFRLRVKATAGVLAVDAFTVNKLYEALDGGILVEPFFIQWANLNAFVGFRSFGAGVGADVTTNMGLYLGYALTWGTWRSNPYLGVSFAF